ncbi:hypothetical protein SOVF_099150, partial [Spinacia oleracea]
MFCKEKSTKISSSGVGMGNIIEPVSVVHLNGELMEAKASVVDAEAEILLDITKKQEVTQVDIEVLQEKVTQLEEARPVPADIMTSKHTRVPLITRPNTGGKTICLKAVGLAALMAKAGLYVLCAEPVRIPLFDSVFAIL